LYSQVYYDRLKTDYEAMKVGTISKRELSRRVRKIKMAIKYLTVAPFMAKLIDNEENVE
jgi:hypothetical protein